MSATEFQSSSERIRAKVDDRHWQLFETRLKNSSSETIRKNYTKSNDYRIIDRWKKSDQSQLPLEPNQRWRAFCSQLTNKSNETDRLLSIFHHVWRKNWNIEREREYLNENDLLKSLSPNEHEKKIISSILHQTT